MAKNAVAAEPSRPEPRASVYWDKDNAKLSGDLSDLALGAKVTLTIRGTVTGYSMNEWGCDLGVKVSALAVAQRSGKDADDGPAKPSLVAMARTLKGGK